MKNNPYARHRFPAEIISHCVWLYNSFSLSLRDIEKKMRKFKSAKQAQRFLSAGELIYQHTQPPRHKLLAAITREMMKKGIEEWEEITGVTVSNQG